jgi:hypothetical protein
MTKVHPGREMEDEESFYPDISMIFEDIYDQVVSSMPENLLPNLREGSGSAQ